MSNPLMEALPLHLSRRIVSHIPLNSRSLPTHTESLPLAYRL
jgi:hypothetical protein